MQLDELNNFIQKLRSFSSNYVEVWDRITIEGNLKPEAINFISGEGETVKSGILELKINNESIEFEEFLAEKESYNYSNLWQVYVYKPNLIKKLKLSDINTILYFDESNFRDWLKDFNPHLLDHPLRGEKPLRILVNSIKSEHRGPKVYVSGFDKSNPSDWPYKSKLPTDKDIKSQVHFITTNKTDVTLEDFLIEYSSTEDEIGKILMQKSFQFLAIALVQEYYSNDKIVLNATKRVECKLIDSNISSISNEALVNLKNAIEWAYSERATTRIALLISRITLEIKKEENFLTTLVNHISDALNQAKEQDRFITLEIKDKYMLELRSFMVDVKKMAEDYSQKLRNLQSNLLRDVLAGLFIISVSLFSKYAFDDHSSNNISSLIFLSKTLSGYFIVSLLLQIIIYWPDILLTQKEIDHWLKKTNNYLSEEEVKNSIRPILSKRRLNFIISASFLGLLYIALAIVSWNFIEIMKCFVQV